MLINKVTVGFVVQTFDTDKQAFVSQEFVASTECTYEVEGDEINVSDFTDRVIGGNEPYLPFEMVQPKQS